MSEAGILCVDDEATILESLKEQLFRCFGERYLIEVASNATEAMDVMEELQDEGIRILVIVSDWLMPGIKGDEFLINVHQQYPDIIKVMLTGQADEAAIARTRKEAQLYAYIHKPWTETELTQVITTALA